MSAVEPTPAAVPQYAAVVMGYPSSRTVEVSRFPSGERHAVYRVSGRDPNGDLKRAVVRVLHSAHPDDIAMAEREAKVLEKVAGAGVPHLYDFRVDSPWFDTPVMCLEYIDGHSTALAEQSRDALTRLGAVVGRIHYLSAEDLAPWLSMPSDLGDYAEQRADSILARMALVDEALPAGLRGRLERAAEVVGDLRGQARDLDSFRAPGAPALLHGDLGPGNILWCTGPVLIDWEYTRGGDPADELAYLFDQNGLDSEQRRAVWTGYQMIETDRPLDALGERITWWEPVQLLGSALWWLERFLARLASEASGAADPSAPRDKQHYLSHVLARLDRFDGLRP